MYRQLASAQLRGRLYKTGYRRTKASPKEVQIGTTGQNAAITTGCGVSAIVAGTPAAPVPSTSQLRTPPRPVRLSDSTKRSCNNTNHDSNLTK